MLSRRSSGDQPLAGFGQRVVLALRQAAGIFRPALGGQGVQHRGHRGGRGAGQVPPQPPGSADGGLQPHRPVIKPVRAGIGTGAGPLDHLLRQRGQIRQARAAPGGGQQDPVRIRPAVLRQLIGPRTQGLRPRAAQLASCERVGDQRMGGQPPGPRHRRTGSAIGDVGEGPQPRGGPVLPIRLMPRWALNAASIRARAAVCWAPACSSPISASA